MASAIVLIDTLEHDGKRVAVGERIEVTPEQLAQGIASGAMEPAPKAPAGKGKAGASETDA